MIKKKIFIKYFKEDSSRLEQKKIGNWIDLHADNNYEYKAGEHFLVDLGIAMQLPKGYEALLAPRSSSFKNYSFIITNSPGVIDTSYCGDNDKWFASCFALRDGKIERGDRVCQMRIIRSQPKLSFIEKTSLGNKDRGGHGSTGK